MTIEPIFGGARKEQTVSRLPTTSPALAKDRAPSAANEVDPFGAARTMKAVQD